MANVSDYLAWRGDITFEQLPLNVVDALLLSQMSYVDLRGIIGAGEKKKECTIAEAAKKFWKLHTMEELDQYVAFALKKAGILLKEMAQTERFSSLVLRNYECRNDERGEEQFCAVEIVLGKKESFISFGGTDDTLVGWKEDFNMCFLMPIPAQTHARDYLERIFEEGRRRVYIGGHSKGGNLSVYAAAKCKAQNVKNILRVYNFDGPGFNKEFIESARYQRIKERVETWVPESSIVGMLLEHEECYRVVKSTENGIMQHDATSWELLGTKFCEAPTVKESSKRLAAGMKEWLSGLKPEELEYFCDCIYEVFTSSDAKSLAELNKDRFKSITSMIRSYNMMDKKAKDMLFAFVKAVIGANLKIGSNTEAERKGHVAR